jgi:hypothetical protein
MPARAGSQVWADRKVVSAPAVGSKIVAVMTRLSQPKLFCSTSVSMPTAVGSQVCAVKKTVSLGSRDVAVMTRLSQPRLFCKKSVSMPARAGSQVWADRKVVSAPAVGSKMVAVMTRLSQPKLFCRKSVSIPARPGSQLVCWRKTVSLGTSTVSAPRAFCKKSGRSQLAGLLDRSTVSLGRRVEDRRAGCRSRGCFARRAYRCPPGPGRRSGRTGRSCPRRPSGRRWSR